MRVPFPFKPVPLNAAKGMRYDLCALACAMVLVSQACLPERERHVADVPDTATSLQTASQVRARQDSVNRAQPGYVVDSIFPIEEQLRRFRLDVSRVHALAGGASSRDALVALTVRAIQRGDSTSLASLAVTQAEFAWLIFPSSPRVAGPTRQAPQVVWYLLTRDSERGRRRLLQRLGAGGMRFERYRCGERATTEGTNHFWNDCLVERRDEQGAFVRQRLFGSIVERGGQFKLLSFANDF